jgi:hypothetical protein
MTPSGKRFLHLIEGEVEQLGFVSVRVGPNPLGGNPALENRYSQIITRLADDGSSNFTRPIR